MSALVLLGRKALDALLDDAKRKVAAWNAAMPTS